MKDLGKDKIKELQALGVSIHNSNNKTPASRKSNTNCPNRQNAKLNINMNDNPKQQNQTKSDCQLRAEAQNGSQKESWLSIIGNKDAKSPNNQVALTTTTNQAENKNDATPTQTNSSATKIQQNKTDASSTVTPTNPTTSTSLGGGSVDSSGAVDIQDGSAMVEMVHNAYGSSKGETLQTPNSG